MNKLYSTAVFKILSYISSLWLASIYFFIKLKDSHFIISGIQLTMSSVATLCVIGYFHIIHKHRSLNNFETIEILEAQQEKFSTSNYLFSNILPILTLDIEDSLGLILCAIIVVILGFIYYKNDLFYINPIYDVLNKRVYTAKVIIGKATKPKETMVISPHPIYNFEKQYAKAIIKNNIIIIDEML